MNEGIAMMLEGFQRVQEQLNGRLFLTALIASLLAAFAASWMYKFFYERRGTGSQVHRAFPLLAVSVTTLFIGVQVSLPLSLGLLGALSIVRFRVPIKEPEEVGFIMLVIAASISAATFQFRFMVLLYLVALGALLLIRSARLYNFFKRDGIFVLTADEAGIPPAQMEELEVVLKACCSRYSLESSATRDGVTSLQYVFSGLKCKVPEFQAKLMQQIAVKSINIFLDRPGGIR